MRLTRIVRGVRSRSSAASSRRCPGRSSGADLVEVALHVVAQERRDLLAVHRVLGGAPVLAVDVLVGPAFAARALLARVDLLLFLDKIVPGRPPLHGVVL